MALHQKSFVEESTDGVKNTNHVLNVELLKNDTMGMAFVLIATLVKTLKGLSVINGA